MALRLLALLVSAAVVADGANVKVSPIQKVTELLKGLQSKITNEGQAEAAEYDKYACFCKDEVTSRRHSIEKSEKKIVSLNGEKTNVDNHITKLGQEISALSQDILAKEGEYKTTKDDARTRIAAYNTADASNVDTIGKLAEAIKRMVKSKQGQVGAKVDFLQVQELINKVSKQAPPRSQFQGNAIKVILEDLLKDATKLKKGADMDEVDKMGLSDTKEQGLFMAIKFANEEKAEKTQLNAAKSAESSDLQTAITAETADLAADNVFMVELTADCENKAKIFDQRSKNRVTELTAMTGAIESLQKGAGAPKMLAQESLLQVRETIQQKGNRAVERVLMLLQDAATDQQSLFLKGAAVRVLISKDHFVKVRGLIKDLLSKLTSDAAAEASEKAFCDTEIGKATASRDKATENKEAKAALISVTTSSIAKKTAEIAELTAGILKNTRAVQEGSELRGAVASTTSKTEWSKEAAADVVITTIVKGTGNAGANEASIATANQGDAAVGTALTLLNDFYNAQGAFVQVAKYTPAKAGRDGQTVADKASSSQSTEYKGAGAESKGIIGMLEVIQADFQRTSAQTTQNEADEVAAWTKAKEDLDADTATKTGDKDTKTGEVTVLNGTLLQAQTDLASETTSLATADKSLSLLKTRCIDQELTPEQRFAQRKAEIASLKSAKTILDEIAQSPAEA